MGFAHAPQVSHHSKVSESELQPLELWNMLSMVSSITEVLLCIRLIMSLQLHVTEESRPTLCLHPLWERMLTCTCTHTHTHTYTHTHTHTHTHTRTHTHTHTCTILPHRGIARGSFAQTPIVSYGSGSMMHVHTHISVPEHVCV